MLAFYGRDSNVYWLSVMHANYVCARCKVMGGRHRDDCENAGRLSRLALTMLQGAEREVWRTATAVDKQSCSAVSCQQRTHATCCLTLSRNPYKLHERCDVVLWTLA